jgi:putative mRNA 3-end processing factor
LCDPFEPVRCDVFITECTFGLPLFRWEEEAVLAAQVNRWWAGLAAQGRPALIDAYSFGKAQRLMTMVDPDIGPILTHPAVEDVTAILRAQGLPLPVTRRLVPGAALPRGALVIAPPGGGLMTGEPLVRAAASGWMALARRRGAGAGFVISDHADWDGLNDAITATGAGRVLVTHGYTGPFRRWLAEARGLQAQVLETAFGAGDGNG